MESCSIVAEKEIGLSSGGLSPMVKCRSVELGLCSMQKRWRKIVGRLIVLTGLLISDVLMAQAPPADRAPAAQAPAARAPAAQAPAAPAPAAQAPAAEAPLDADYRLAANDLVDFRVFQEPELDSVIRVSGDGNAIFPLIGPVPVAGKTIGEATEMLRKRYMSGYLVNPQVNLTVRTYARKVFTVLGQVQRPGSYEIQGSDSISLLDAIGMAGGYTRIANPGNVTVKRREGGVENVYRFNAKKMARSQADSTFSVKPGDVITVAESIF
jgi:protein involved in polysaccharide export with SLBB domain